MGNPISMADRPLGRFLPNPKLRLKEQFHEVCRFRHVAVRTEESYWGWVVRLVRFFNSKINPRDMNDGAVEGFFLAPGSGGQGGGQHAEPSPECA